VDHPPIDPRFRYPDLTSIAETFVCYLDDWDVSSFSRFKNMVITRGERWCRVVDVLDDPGSYPAISPEQVDRLRAIYTLYRS
jgi:hypothetical protein